MSTDETMESGQVVLQVFGDKGSTGPVVLSGPPSNGPSFMRGSTDEFKVHIFYVLTFLCKDLPMTLEGYIGGL